MVEDDVRRNHVAVVLLLVSMFAISCTMHKDELVASRQVAPAVPVASFAGCYELTLERWWPWSLGEDTKYATPPTLVKLLLERGTVGFEKNEFLVRALPARKGTVSGRGGPSYGQIKASNRIDLIWTDGFTGVTLALEKSGDELHGWAHPHFDAPKLVPRIAHVTARRTACTPPL
jgi:hypothetical protein